MINTEKAGGKAASIYNTPELEFMKIEVSDVISTSSDENKGEWDKQ